MSKGELVKLEIRPVLKPGDVLLYASKGWIAWVIKTKTWSDINHTETYLGDELSAASRDGLGVDTYPTRWEGLKYVLRPQSTIDLAAGALWHKSVCKQGYDWLGLLASFFSQKGGSSTKMFCSEHTARLAQRFGYFPFGSAYDCDKVSPGMFKASPVYDLVWSVKQTKS